VPPEPVPPTPTPPAPTPEPTPDACPGDEAPAVVDVVNGTGDQAVADDVAAALGAAGLTVGAVGTGAPATSGIEFPAGQEDQAQWLAGALATTLVRTGDVPHVTVVLAAADSADLLAAVDALPACG
jgi:hypothetical protein